MKTYTLGLFFLVLFFETSGQTISGFVRDKVSGENLPSASIKDLASGRVAHANSYGFFSILLDKFPATVEISSVGYKKNKQLVSNYSTKQLIIELVEEDNTLNEITVRSDKEQASLDKLPIGLTSISIKRLKAIPTLFGEADLLKALTLTPGVSNANEGTTGILVRGGSPDQNLILIDETPVYNISHLFGLVSVFNPDALKNVNLYKAAFPARYGGRLSSVIDITSKEGNTKKRNTEIGVGLINSRFLWEGPMNTHKTNSPTFFLSARASNLSFMLLPTYIRYANATSANYFNYALWDINAKINKQFKNNSTLYLSTYIGNDTWFVKNKSQVEDNTTVVGKSSLKWGNITTSIRYILPLNQKLFFKTTAAFTQYHYGIGTENSVSKKTTDFLDSKTIIQDNLLKSSIEYYANSKHEFRVGTDLTLHRFMPIRLRASYDFLSPDNNKKISAFEAGNYIESKNQFTKWFSLHSGLRYALFTADKKTYTSWEPRLATHISLANDFTLKIGYSKMKQFVHLLTSSSAGLPNDLWIPATQQIPPQNSSQIAFGLAKNIGKGMSVSIEAYKKKYDNLIEYKNGFNYLTNTDIAYENTIEKNGIGKGHGLELFVDKNTGNFTGWLAYTLSWNYRKFQSINQGNWYEANFDRRHNLALTGNYHISENREISANWIFQSGSPTTVPIASMKSPIFNRSNTPIFVYGDRNNYRTPAYHRLDISYNLKKETYRGHLRTWTLGIYNAYNQKNPFYLDVHWGVIKDNPQTNEIKGWTNNLVKRSVIPFLPFINYSLKLK